MGIFSQLPFWSQIPFLNVQYFHLDAGFMNSEYRPVIEKPCRIFLVFRCRKSPLGCSETILGCTKTIQRPCQKKSAWVAADRMQSLQCTCTVKNIWTAIEASCRRKTYFFWGGTGVKIYLKAWSKSGFSRNFFQVVFRAQNEGVLIRASVVISNP